MALLVFALVVASMALAELGPGWMRRLRRRSSAPEQPATLSPPPVPGVVDADSDAEREEMTLAKAVVAGDLPTERYRHRMGELAAHDARRDPLIVPPEQGSWPAPQ